MASMATVWCARRTLRPTSMRVDSTMADFSKFVQMLLNGGTFDGKTYLTPKTFELMASDHIGKDSGVERDYFYFPGDGFGMGLGLAVRTDPGNAKPPPPGSLGELI